MARAAETYKRALIGHQPGLTWDYVVLTAANEHQAAGYRHELAIRSSGQGPLGAFFPASQQTLVVPDPPGFRAGSGGATFGVLRAIADHQKATGVNRGKPFEHLRILLIHSGGASQRLPQYSPLGKIFAPLPLVRPDGQLMTLFDQLYLMLAGLPPRLGPGMLVAAGDVFLLFDAGTMPAVAANPGTVALTMRVPAEVGVAHGVFRVDAAKPREAFPLVTGTMQKATVEQMRSAGVTDARDRVLIDSGLVFFDAHATANLYTLSRKYTPAWHLKHRRQIDLYAEAVPAALTSAPPTLTGDPVARKLHEDLRRALADAPLRAYELPDAHFLHLGTTRQFRDAMVGLDPHPAAALFQQNVLCVSDAALPASSRVYHSVIADDQVSIEPHVIVENCRLAGPLAIGHGSVLSNLELQGPGRLPPETLLFSVPLQTGKSAARVTVIAGVHDDFKTDRTFCNIDLRHWLMLAGLDEGDLWDREQRTRNIWTARLFPAAPLGPLDLLWMPQPATTTPAQRNAWRKAARYAMADILELADAAALARHRDAICGLLQGAQWVDLVEAGAAGSVQNTVHSFGAAGYDNLTRIVADAASAPATPPLTRARLNWTLAEVQARPDYPRDNGRAPAVAALQRRAFDCIREAMSSAGAKTQSAKRKMPKAAGADVRLRTGTDEMVASAPVRLDLAGGWTDTPPYCLENGGIVVNVAVNLNDVEPIQSTLRPIDEPVVRLVSRDLGRTLTITDPDTLRKPVEPGDPFALHTVALRLAGLAPTDGETSQRKWLSRLAKNGRGFELITASNLPKGSGMGTSSILGATTLAVLRAATGQDTAPATLFEQTLLLEQHLGTGGGWQDQVGGIVGGAKVTQTRPGIPQVLKVRRLKLPRQHAQGLEDRLVVYFTGQQRLARNILREVMGRYLSREPATMVLFHELAQNAEAMEKALRNADWISCATEVNRYWRIKRDLFPGSTTPAIDALFLELRPYYLGGCLAGAGGGGFAYFLCADADQAHRLRTELARLSMRPGSLGLTFATTLNHKGLRVS